MLKLWKVPTSHEELFIERYHRLLSWSRQLTGRDQQRAEDVVHDTFVQFILRRPPLNTIENLDAYLYSMLKNTHLSQARRASQDPNRHLSLVEFDSMEIGLRLVDPYTQLEVQQELRRICEYAILRKETSKAGSVLILRFFHGYYPSEIADVSRTTRTAVDKWVQIARAEARLYIDDPGCLVFMRDCQPTDLSSIDFGGGASEFVKALTEAIFNSRRGECLAAEDLKQMYRAIEAGPLDAEHLAHIVSCATCLNLVNKSLGIPLLSQRLPADSLGPKTRPKSGPPGGGPSGTVSGDDAATKCLRRVKETVEHKPKELRVAANGYFLASHKIRSEVTEQDLSLNVGEPIGFVEVFSEQGIRLILFDVESPPAGAFDQAAVVKFDDGRSLETRVSFNNPWPTLRVVYADPGFNEAESLDLTALEREADLLASHTPTVHEGAGSKARQRLLLIATLFREWLTPGRLWLRPAAVTMLLAIITCLALLLMRGPVAAPSAAELLSRAIVAEEMVAAAQDQVIHRTLQLEERRVGQLSSSPDGDLISRRRVEIWQSRDRGIKVRRLYDEKNNLLAGEWSNPDGSRLLYHHGSKPRAVPQSPSAISFDSVWRLEPSAKDFQRMAEGSAVVQVVEGPTSYTIEFAGPTDLETSSVLKATLVLDRSSLRAGKQTLLIEQDGERREYRILEIGLERQPATSVDPGIFEPDPELLGAESGTLRNGDTKKDFESSPLPVSPIASIATADLEIETLRLLSSVGADLGEQINLSRTTDGQLRIEGVVETRKRKDQILQALQPVTASPALKVDLRSVEEAVVGTPPRRSKSNEVVVEREEITADKFPADADLRRYLSGRGVGPSQLDEEARKLAGQMIGQSNQVMRHAWALKSLVDRFSREDIHDFNDTARANWRSLIRNHAIALSRQATALRQRLAPVFPAANSGTPIAEPTVEDDDELVSVVRELFGLCSATDRVVRAAFSVSPDSAKAADVRSLQFGRDLRSIEVLARVVSK